MNKQKTITINGVSYDAHTGVRLSEAEQTAPRVSASSHNLHKKQHRTQTLKRSHVTSPHAAKLASKQAEATASKKPAVTRSPMIQKFAQASHQQPQASRVISDIGPVQHPVQVKVAARTTHQKAAPKPHAPLHAAPQPKPASEIKKHSIEKALHNAQPAKKARKGSFAKRHPRLVSISSATLAIALLGGYLTYLNLPNISVRVAAAQAGIAATYPSYQPSGYSLKGPVAYNNGQVSMNFAANVGPQDFTVNQVKSSWDSSALLTNYVAEKSSGDYQTLSSGGLTIYTYRGNAAWVNGGILHTIEGDAPLSPDQIRKIATSM